jgi:hypothetical protein
MNHFQIRYFRTTRHTRRTITIKIISPPDVCAWMQMTLLVVPKSMPATLMRPRYPIFATKANPSTANTPRLGKMASMPPLDASSACFFFNLLCFFFFTTVSKSESGGGDSWTIMPCLSRFPRRRRRVVNSCVVVFPCSPFSCSFVVLVDLLCLPLFSVVGFLSFLVLPAISSFFVVLVSAHMTD